MITRCDTELIIEDLKDVIETMKIKALFPEDIRNILGLPKSQKSNKKVNNTISFISRHFPLYNPCNGMYKILTKSDLDRYEELKRYHIVEDQETYDWN